MPHLEFLHRERALFHHVLGVGRTLLGRSDQCDVALPSDSVSRVHCLIEPRADGWWLVDRSRHGTRINGEVIPTRRRLDHGDVIGIGDYEVRFSEEDPESMRAPTASVPRLGSAHEEVVEGDEGGLTTQGVALRVMAGPRTGEVLRLERPLTEVGGPGADLVLAEDLPRSCARVRVVRGRAMVEPGEAAVVLAGSRVRGITPVLEGEEIRVGEHALTLELHTHHHPPHDLDSFGQLVGVSEQMRALFGSLARMAACDHPVLLTGESGTGKELAARALHDSGRRSTQPFVAVNCAGVPATLFESELFGHERGAFTGATDRQDGAYQRADGGTLFLDEVGELPLEAQAKLLRALESGEVRRVGGRSPEFPDVRIVAATNRDLPTMVTGGAFRADLYFRLHVLAVFLPALRDRQEDLPVLTRAILARTHPDATLDVQALEALQGYAWPGNVRELRNVLTRAYVMHGSRITAGSLSFNPWSFQEATLSSREDRDGPERRAILAALARHEGNRTRAARDLGMPRSSLLYKIKKLKLQEA